MQQHLSMPVGHRAFIPNANRIHRHLHSLLMISQTSSTAMHTMILPLLALLHHWGEQER